MKRHKYYYLLFIVIISSCVNLKVVNDYASTSAKAVESYRDINFSFTSLCLRECEVKALNERISNDFVPLNELLPCDCIERAKSDKAISTILFGLTSYLESIEKISNNESSNTFKFDDLANSLSKVEFIKIEEKEINAYKSLSNLISKIILDNKRQKELKTSIANANVPFSVLIDKLMYIIDNQYMEVLEIHKSIENNEYKALLKFSNSKIEKIEIEKLFFERLKIIDTKKQRLIKYRDILKSIKDGHNELNNNQAKLDSRSLAKQLSEYYTSIKKLKSEFDNLKTDKK